VGPPKLREHGRADWGFRMIKGRHHVITVNRTTDSGHGPDSEIFYTTTIELPRIPADLADGATWKTSARKSYYVEGATGFIHNGHYLWRTDPVQTLEISKNRSILNLRLSSKFEARSKAGSKIEKVVLHVDCPLQSQLGEPTPSRGR
jgi:hypothetical protein